MAQVESDTEEIIVLYLYAKQQRKRKRRVSVHEILQRRSEFGEYHHLIQELHFLPAKFHQYFRMTEEQFDYILQLIGDDICKQDTNWKKDITPRERLAICLRFLTTGDSYKTIAFSYRVGVATVAMVVREVCEAIWNQLQPIHLPEPTQELWRQNKNGFRERWQFPNCIGALDGKHVLIQVPPCSGSTYFNYKKSFSIVLLALVDYRYRFTFVNIGSYGSNCDSGIFRNSALCRKMQNKTLAIPDDKPLIVDDQPCPQVIAGDEGFPLMSNLMRPYPGSDLNDAKRIYNYRLSRARRISENAFGILANRWRLYHRKLPLSPGNVDCVVKATIVLHNMLCGENEVGAHRDDVDNMEEDIHDGVLSPLRRTGHRLGDTALEVREQFKNYFVSPAGAVTWQMDACFGHAN